MSATAQISLQDYLDTNFEERPPEYVDGALVERPITSIPHGEVQSRFDRRLGGVCEAHGLTVVVEAPMRVGGERIRIADVAVFQQEPMPSVAEHPPVLIVEVLSPSDTWKGLRERIREYLAWGVAHVWPADPGTRELFVVAASADPRQVPRLELPQYGIRITPDEVF